MRAASRRPWAVVIAAGAALAIIAPAGRAQDPRGSLSGYGGSAMAAGSGPGAGGPFIPYAGRFGGFMPSRMGGGGPLSFQPRGASAMGSGRATFSLAPSSGGMASMSGGMGRGLGARAGLLSPPDSGIGMGGMRPSAQGPGRMGVMPPSFAYPFRQPPSLASPSPGTGMSM